ncbi:MAG: adenosylmethionine decarboxylase [bacterium]
MEALGQHLLIELYECDKDILNDEKRVAEILTSAAEVCGATVLNTSSHKFSPQGVSAIIMIAESHFSIHTWPEYCYGACDVFTCGTTLKPDVAVDYLVKEFEAKNFTLHEIKRGTLKLPEGKKLTHK